MLIKDGILIGAMFLIACNEKPELTEQQKQDSVQSQQSRKINTNAEWPHKDDSLRLAYDEELVSLDSIVGVSKPNHPAALRALLRSKIVKHQLDSLESLHKRR